MFQIIFLFLDKFENERTISFMREMKEDQKHIELFFSIMRMFIAKFNEETIINLASTITFEGKLFTPSQIL